MGFDLVLIATSDNDLKVPLQAKCCLCNLLLDCGVRLSSCDHHACYKCMQKRADVNSICPLDGKRFDVNKYRFLPKEIEEWLNGIKLKCRWFDGNKCSATGIALRKAHRHEGVCPNRPQLKNNGEKQMLAKKINKSVKQKEVDAKEKIHTNNDADDDSTLKKQYTRNSSGTNTMKIKSTFENPSPKNVGHRFFPNNLLSHAEFYWRN